MRFLGPLFAGEGPHFDKLGSPGHVATVVEAFNKSLLKYAGKCLAKICRKVLRGSNKIRHQDILFLESTL